MSNNNEKNEAGVKEGGNHKRIPSYIKSIPLTKYSKPPNKLEEDRKKVY